MTKYGVEDTELEEGPDFNQRISGYYGSFNTEQSYEVNYLLCSLTAKEFKLLDIASEAFKFDQVDFEEMVQRDVDPVRVQEEIIDQYLKNGANRALFFPPIIVSVIAFDNDDKPIHQFKEIVDENEKNAYIKRWDNFFAIEARIAKDGSSMHIKNSKGELIPILPYLSKIHYDDKKVKLVVIDGQHRFYALRQLLKTGQQDLIKNLSLPICIVFSPDAINNNGKQDVMVNLRGMFVTINNKSKEVSGHFLDLLNDHSIASFCVRELANQWKGPEHDSLKSNLQHMEWNQRIKSKSNQINKQHSITTVSIIADVLRNHVFNSRRDSKTYNLLRLGTKKKELENHPNSTSVYYITESEFDVEQAGIIRELVKENMVPCLEWLFLQPTVYKVIRERYLKALETLEEKVAAGIEGWATFRSLLKDFKESNKLSPEPAVIAESQFNKEITLEKSIETYRRNVFQQGYVRVWSQVADMLVAEYGVSPILTAKAIVKAFEKTVFDYRLNIFEKDQPYANLTLYDKSNKPKVDARGKQSWTEVIMCFFLESKTIDEFVAALNQQTEGAFGTEKLGEIKAKLSVLGGKALGSYAADFRDRLEKDFNNNWRLKEFPKAFKADLESYLAKNDAESQEKFKKAIDEKVAIVYRDSIQPLFGLLGVDINKVCGVDIEPDDNDDSDGQI